jgi:hypothetical protein
MQLKYFAGILLCLFLISIDGRSQSKAIISGVAWFDQFNNEVNAHGACIVENEGKYYLFGEYKSDTANVFTGFSCYSSSDLINWKFEKIVLPKQTSGLLGPNRIGERVKVMKCPETGEFVMYMHTDDMKYNDPQIGFASCKTINGDYQFQGALLHEGNPIRRWDMGTFQDNDGKGYLLIHHGLIYELASDYKSAKRIVVSQVPTGESPTIFKKNGVYFWLSSHLTSWERNDNYYMTATSLEGPWKMRGLFAPEGSLTWNSQCSFVLPITSAKDTFLMYMGDRWSFPHQGSAATYVWQPISVKGDSMSIAQFQQSWKINLSKGQWYTLETKEESIKDKYKVVSGNWNVENGKPSSKEKGAVISYSFKGTQVGIKAVSNSTGGYAKVIIKNSKNEEIISTLVDFYSKYEYSSLKFLSPLMKNDKYTVSIEVSGEHSKWSDKRKNDYGSTDNFIIIEDVLVFKD